MKAKEQEASAFPKIGAPATRALEAAGYSRLERVTEILKKFIHFVSAADGRVFFLFRRVSCRVLKRQSFFLERLAQ